MLPFSCVIQSIKLFLVYQLQWSFVSCRLAITLVVFLKSSFYVISGSCVCPPVFQTNKDIGKSFHNFRMNLLPYPPRLAVLVDARRAAWLLSK